MKKTILIVTPRSPFLGRGADEQDRLSGILWWQTQGYKVCVITKVTEKDAEHIDDARQKYKLEIIAVPYQFSAQRTIGQKILRLLKRLLNPLHWDGAAFEYFDPTIQSVVLQKIKEYEPALVWFDYTYLWPLYRLVPKNIPIITRSINLEPIHFLDEDGRNPFNYLRALPKWFSEIIVARKSNHVFSITPREEEIYKKMGATVSTLPLRGLPKEQVVIIRETLEDPVHLGFTASTYNVAHNREALQFLLQEVMPPLLLKSGKKYTLHITGLKMPEEILKSLSGWCIYEGFVPDMFMFWNAIDIAVIPSLFGAGMQQKVFEPIALGVPTVTSKRAVAGYPFFHCKEFMCASSASEFVENIEKLAQNKSLRRSLSESAKKTSSQIFSQQAGDKIINSVLENLHL